MDIEKLICVVQEHAVLYCTSHPDYRRTKLKDELWDKIGAEFNLEGSIVKEQWQKVRECHREALRRQKKKSGLKADPPRPWIYQQQMEFLLPFMKNGCPTTKLEPSATDSTDEDESAYPGREAIDDLDEPPNQNAGTGSDEIEKTDANESCASKKMKKKGNCVPESEKTVVHDTLPRKNFVRSTPIRQYLGKCAQRAKSRDELGQNLLLENKTVQEKDALYQFFMAMYCTTKELPASYQRQIRNQIFEVVSQTEEQYELDKSRNLQFPHFFTGRSPQDDGSN